MIATVVGVLGAVALAAGALLLLSLGPRYRVGRSLWAAPAVGIDEARRMARVAGARYVRVSGRITSDEEFPDEHDRPLVFRRRRIEVEERGARWRLLEDDREAVPFAVETRGEGIAIDREVLADGLVVVPRESVGRLADLPVERRGSGDPAARARLIVEQVSAVEHATVAGVPRLGRDGEPEMSAGLGRPLILTTLELPAAMRVLAAGRRRRLVAAAFLMPFGLTSLLSALVLGLLGI